MANGWKWVEYQYTSNTQKRIQRTRQTLQDHRPHQSHEQDIILLYAVERTKINEVNISYFTVAIFNRKFFLKTVRNYKTISGENRTVVKTINF